ncbi:MAG: RNA 2',3'-cyclic phosphodiesterase [Phycisphaerae bacterium]
MNTVRTFIAIELPEEVRDYLGRCQERLKAAGANVKWTRPAQIHLTLAFLGNVPADELDVLAEAVREALTDFGPLALRATGTGQFPPGGRPRVLWVGVQADEGDLVGLQQAVARAAAPFAEKQEHRAFHPHLTLGRVRQGRRGRRGRRGGGGGGPGDLAALGRAVAEAAEESGPAFDADEVVVFQSDLGREGPTYTPLARLPLAAGGEC